VTSLPPNLTGEKGEGGEKTQVVSTAHGSPKGKGEDVASSSHQGKEGTKGGATAMSHPSRRREEGENQHNVGRRKKDTKTPREPEWKGGVAQKGDLSWV